MAEKISSGKVGLSAIPGLGDEMNSRYYTRSVVGDMLGPSFGTANDMIRAINAMFTDELTRSDLRAIRRLVPYQNLSYLRWAFDDVEELSANALGIQ